jgi:enoyl-CoA hydratase
VVACKNPAMSLVLTELVPVDAAAPDGPAYAVVTLNNPGERNTLTAPMVTEIVAAMEAIEADGRVGAVVVTGAAPAFCAGANLGNLAEADGTSLGNVYEGFLRVARSPLPTIAAVNGAAVGAGMNLALCCDLRLAARRARFDTRFLQIGIHPGGGHTWMLRRIVGPQATFAGVVFGEVMDGAEAERVGLVHRCVDDDQLLTAAGELAARAASAPRELVIEVKRTIQAMADVDTHPDAVARELTPQLWSTRQPWFAERLAALQQKISSK